MNKQYILKANHEIEQVLVKKQSIGTKYYVLYFDRIMGDCKITVSVSKKLGKAVVRNYQKRVTKEILRNFIPLLKGYRILLVLKKSTLELSFEEKAKQVEYILNKLIHKNN